MFSKLRPFYGKRAKTAEMTTNRLFGEFFRGGFAKHLC